MLSFTPICLPELRQHFLDYHEHVPKSSLSTVRRYRAATQHLENFVALLPKTPQAHEVKADAFAAYLRQIEVAPNGHIPWVFRMITSLTQISSGTAEPSVCLTATMHWNTVRTSTAMPPARSLCLSIIPHCLE